MDTKLPHIPDYKPSAKEPIKPAPTVERSRFSNKKKLGLVVMTGLVALVGLGMIAVGSPVKLYKRASTAAEMKNDTYNKDVYQLSCDAPNYWAVPEANPGQCDPNDTTIKCGQVCLADRQTGITNPEGHMCCKPESTTQNTQVSEPEPTQTPLPPTTAPQEPTTAVEPTSSVEPTSNQTQTSCPLPKAVTGLTVFCPACQGGQ